MSTAAPPPTIEVIIVNFCTGSLVMACLESLAVERLEYPQLRAIVVDNASGDGSAELIGGAIAAREWDWVQLLKADNNGGFGAGNNLGICRALAHERPADLFWLLNPDTEVRRSAVRELADFMQSHMQAGVAGTALLEEDGRLWPHAFRFPTILSEIERGAHLGLLTRLLRNRAVLRTMGTRPEEVDWVSGASMVIRRELLEHGLRFDQTFFLYYEETDFCLQARRAGWECWYVPNSVVLHIAGQSTGVTGNRHKFRRLPGYWFNSRRYYFLKNHGRVYTMLADLAWISGHLIAVTKRVMRGLPPSEPPRLLSDFLRHSAFMPGRLAR